MSGLAVEYRVRVSGLEEARAAAQAAGVAAREMGASLEGARRTGVSTLPLLVSSVRSLNAARLAVVQTSEALEDLDLPQLMYGFLNMVQVVQNLVRLTNLLRESTASASAAQAVLLGLTGRWYLVPAALAAGALVLSRVKSMQEGGPVGETGLYLLHRGEYVVPHTTRVGPVFVTVNTPPRGLGVGSLLEEVASRVLEEVERGGA